MHMEQKRKKEPTSCRSSSAYLVLLLCTYRDVREEEETGGKEEQTGQRGVLAFRECVNIQGHMACSTPYVADLSWFANTDEEL